MGSSYLRVIRFCQLSWRTGAADKVSQTGMPLAFRIPRGIPTPLATMIALFIVLRMPSADLSQNSVLDAEDRVHATGRCRRTRAASAAPRAAVRANVEDLTA